MNRYSFNHHQEWPLLAFEEDFASNISRTANNYDVIDIFHEIVTLSSYTEPVVLSKWEAILELHVFWNQIYLVPKGVLALHLALRCRGLILLRTNFREIVSLFIVSS